MNEKIKELMLEATKDMPETYYWPGQYVEKFAELLEKEFEAKHFSAGYIAGRSDGTIETVKECISITDDLVNRNVDGSWTSNELYTDYNGALFEVKRRIEEHFGVEE